MKKIFLTICLAIITLALVACNNVEIHLKLNSICINLDQYSNIQ